MVIIEMQAAEYLVRFAMSKYDWYAQGVILMPREDPVVQTIIARAKAIPTTGRECDSPEASHGSGPVGGQSTLRVAIRESWTAKDMREFTYLTKTAMLQIERLLRLDFDITLIEYMNNEYFHKGIDYAVSAEEFLKHYNLIGSITSAALLKKCIRWKKKRREYRQQCCIQAEIAFE